MISTRGKSVGNVRKAVSTTNGIMTSRSRPSTARTSPRKSVIPTRARNASAANLQPSLEVVEHYRRRLAECDREYDDLARKIEVCRSVAEDRAEQDALLREKDEEISELQRSLSDLQACLFQEREHALRLYAKSDKLKIQELESHRKIQTLLQLTGLTEREVTYFFKEPPAKAVVQQRLPAGAQPVASRVVDPSHLETAGSDVSPDLETARLQVEALKRQLEDQSRLSQEQQIATSKEREIAAAEERARREKDRRSIKDLNDKLKKSQQLLFDTTHDLLEARKENRKREKQLSLEKDQLLRELQGSTGHSRSGSPLRRSDTLHSSGSLERDVVHSRVGSPERRFFSNQSESIDRLENSDHLEERVRLSESVAVSEAQRLAEHYREQLMKLEGELSRAKEEKEETERTMKEKMARIMERLKLTANRHKALERRRNLEAQGYRTDIKGLREQMRTLERHLYQLSQNEPIDLDKIPLQDIDLRILREVQQTTNKAKVISDELHRVKAKVYGLEEDLRKL